MSAEVYLCIDLKSYYASAEAAARNYNPLTTNLVVADASRTEKTICLAVSPSLKAFGIGGRARLFEVVQKVREINAERFQRAMKLKVLPRDRETGRYHFASASFDAEALAADPSLELSYIVAPPRMQYYEELSTKIFGIYRKYISPEDIHVYSIDEVFIDVTRYLQTYRMTARELAMSLIREVLYETHITATAGIGTSLYLAKIAMDIVAKRVPADRDGVRIAELDEQSYREKLWCHRPLTDFWRVGPGTARRLERMGCFTMGDVARLSLRDEDRLYRAFGVNAELLIDHAWGWEPVDIAAVRAYRPETSSLSSGQVLAEPYPFEKGRLIVREMTEGVVLDLLRKGVAVRKMELHISYDAASLTVSVPAEDWRDAVYAIAGTGEVFDGQVTLNHYGKPHPHHTHGTADFGRWTNGRRRILTEMLELYDRIVDPRLLVRRVNIAAIQLCDENQIPQELPKGVCREQLSFFDDRTLDTEAERLSREREEAAAQAEQRERRVQKAALAIQEKYGKNAVLKGCDFLDGATARERNAQIGGHRSGSEGFRGERRNDRNHREA